MEAQFSACDEELNNALRSFSVSCCLPVPRFSDVFVPALRADQYHETGSGDHRESSEAKRGTSFPEPEATLAMQSTPTESAESQSG
jgi:hypothetical protein